MNILNFEPVSFLYYQLLVHIQFIETILEHQWNLCGNPVLSHSHLFNYLFQNNKLLYFITVLTVFNCLKRLFLKSIWRMKQMASMILITENTLVLHYYLKKKKVANVFCTIKRVFA